MKFLESPHLTTLLLLALGVSLLALEGSIAVQGRAKAPTTAIRSRIGVGLPARVNRKPTDSLDPTTTPQTRSGAPKQVRAGVVTYAVQSGDTLGAISYRFYGKASRWRLILAANRDILPGPHRLKVGAVLRIPPSEING